MPDFIFHNPTKLIFGTNTILLISYEIKKSGISKILLLAGSSSIQKNGIYQLVVNSLENSGIR